MEWLKQMSLKKSLFTLTLINLLAATALSVFAFGACLAIKTQIAPQGFIIDPNTSPIQMTPLAEPSKEAIRLAAVFELLQFVLPVVIFICSSFASAVVFYRLKLKNPLAVLTGAASRIIANDLDFTVEIDTADELGRLCVAFETMRQSLLENHKELWRQTEERKRLNAAFSHELRNPVTVLKGAVKLAEQSVKSGKHNPELLMDNLTRMEDYTRRIEEYVETMSSVQRLEQIPLGIKSAAWDTLITELEQTARLVGMDSGKEIVFEARGNVDTVSIDKSVCLQVTENLVSNALRFAEHTIHISCAVNNDALELSVADDGKGFPHTLLQNGVQPFQKGKEETAHFGMGLYVCRLLCRKHGGDLEIENTPTGPLAQATIKIL